MIRDFGDAAATSESFEILARRLSAIYMNEKGYGWDVGNVLQPADPLDLIPRHVVKAAIRESTLRKKASPGAASGDGKSKWNKSGDKSKSKDNNKFKNNKFHEKKRAEPSPSSGGAGASK